MQLHFKAQEKAKGAKGGDFTAMTLRQISKLRMGGKRSQRR